MSCYYVSTTIVCSYHDGSINALTIPTLFCVSIVLNCLKHVLFCCDGLKMVKVNFVFIYLVMDSIWLEE